MSHMKSVLLARTGPMLGHLQAYDNNLTAIIPDLYEGMDLVSRSLVGFVPSVFRNSTAERAAVGQQITYNKPVTPTKFSVTPAMTIPEPTGMTPTVDTMEITKSVGYEFGWTGEEQLSIRGSFGASTVTASAFAEALALLTDEIEQDLGIEAIANGSRAIGTAGTTPFAANFNEIADIRKILDDNGAPKDMRSLVTNTSAAANLRKLSQLTKVNEAGTSMTLRQGELLDIHGFSIKESAASGAHTKGTGAGYLVNGVLAVGATTITVDTGAGTVLAGDVVTFAGDTNKYVVVEALAAGSFKIGGPGLRVVPADNAAVTVGNNYVGNVAFTQRSIHLITRAPALPTEGDAAVDSFMLTDPRSGLTFEVRVYAGYRKVRYEVANAWGVKAVKDSDIALLLG